MHFESGYYELSLLQIAGIQIIDYDIGVENNLLEKLHFSCLNYSKFTSITLRTPSGTFMSASA